MKLLSQSNVQKIGWKWIAIALFGVFVGFVYFFDVTVNVAYRFSSGKVRQANVLQQQDYSGLEAEVLPSDGVTLPIEWNNLGGQMIDAGVIDADKFETLYKKRGGLGKQEKKYLYSQDNKDITMDAQNAGVLLNLFWAFGLANKNPILEDGPMKDPRYGGNAGRFASTGGWNLAKSTAMDYYGRYSFAVLTPEQQERVERVSKNIYRPCCGNSTYFPDCNHGMAMLGLLELMAEQDVSEDTMYEIALKVNSYWFPSTYLTIAKYFGERGVAWHDVSPKEVLGSAYSSAAGYQQVRSAAGTIKSGGGGSCGV